MWRLILVLVSLLLLAWGIFISVGGPQTPTALGTLAKFSGCMTKQNFVDSEMYRWANKDAEGSTCSSCHQDGLARFNTNPDRNIMFTMNRYEVFILGFFTVAVDPITAENKVVIDKAKLENKGKGGNLHPTFKLNDQYFGYLQDFYDRTATMAASACGPAVFPTAPM